MSTDPIVIGTIIGIAGGVFVREVVKFILNRVKSNGLPTTKRSYNEVASKAQQTLDRIDQEWRKNVDQVLNEFERDIRASDGHVHIRIHALENELTVELQKILLRLESLDKSVMTLQTITRKGQSDA